MVKKSPSLPPLAPLSFFLLEKVAKVFVTRLGHDVEHASRDAIVGRLLLVPRVRDVLPERARLAGCAWYR